MPECQNTLYIPEFSEGWVEETKQLKLIPLHCKVALAEEYGHDTLSILAELCLPILELIHL